MRYIRHGVAMCLTILVLVSGCGGDDSGGQSSSSQSASQLSHLFLIVMENHATNEIIGNTADAPYLNQLASQYGAASNYFGVTHPSLPNYLALFSGDFQGIWDDCKAGQDVTCAPEEFVPTSGDATSAAALTPAELTSATNQPHWFNGQNLVDQLEAHHLSWKAYMQSMPAGFTGEYSPVDTVNGQQVPRKLYAQKHNPFMYFSDIRNNPARMQLIVPFTQFAQDIASSDVPNLVWISPDQCNDMHGLSTDNAAAVGIPDCGYPASGLDHSVIRLGDTFLSTTVPAIMSSPAWKQNSAIVIVWDEDDYAGFNGCCNSPTGANGVTLGGASAPVIILTSQGPKQVTSDVAYNHYALLATIQQQFGLGCLANSCGFGAPAMMTQFFAIKP
jgi:phosphatidylinositol-3-phosphatase